MYYFLVSTPEQQWQEPRFPVGRGGCFHRLDLGCKSQQEVFFQERLERRGPDSIFGMKQVAEDEGRGGEGGHAVAHTCNPNSWKQEQQHPPPRAGCTEPGHGFQYPHGS